MRLATLAAAVFAVGILAGAGAYLYVHPDIVRAAFSGSPNYVSFGGDRLTNVGAPVASTDAATMAYTQSVSGGLSPHFQVFTSNGTWTIPSGVTTTLVTICGGGGGGGYGGMGYGYAGGGGGGGGAGTCLYGISVGVSGSSVPVTVGYGGSGYSDTTGASYLRNGYGVGGTSYFGSVTAPGGPPGFAGTGGYCCGYGMTTYGYGGGGNGGGGAGGLSYGFPAGWGLYNTISGGVSGYDGTGVGGDADSNNAGLGSADDGNGGAGGGGAAGYGGYGGNGGLPGVLNTGSDGSGPGGSGGNGIGYGSGGGGGGGGSNGNGNGAGGGSGGSGAPGIVIVEWWQ
jgi:hypothetical protein